MLQISMKAGLGCKLACTIKPSPSSGQGIGARPEWADRINSGSRASQELGPAEGWEPKASPKGPDAEQARRR